MKNVAVFFLLGCVWLGATLSLPLQPYISPNFNAKVQMYSYLNPNSIMLNWTQTADKNYQNPAVLIFNFTLASSNLDQLVIIVSGQTDYNNFLLTEVSFNETTKECEQTCQQSSCCSSMSPAVQKRSALFRSSEVNSGDVPCGQCTGNILTFLWFYYPEANYNTTCGSNSTGQLWSYRSNTWNIDYCINANTTAPLWVKVSGMEELQFSYLEFNPNFPIPQISVPEYCSCSYSMGYD